MNARLLTHVIQKWVWKELICRIWHFAPWVMNESFKKRESYNKNKHNLNTVPAEVKNKSGEKNEIFND